MRKLLLLFLFGATLLLSVATLAAQNSVDVLGGTQPVNTTGCAVNPNCIPATWSTTSNAGTDISTAITANFVFVPNGGALATDFPSATSGRICLADTRDLTTPTLFEASLSCSYVTVQSTPHQLSRYLPYPRPTGTFCGILSDSTRRPEFPITRFESMWLLPLCPATLPVSTTAQVVRLSRHSLVREPRITPPMRVCVCPRGQARPSSPA